MAANDIFGQIKNFQKRITSVERAEGKIISIAGPVAYVMVGGSTQVQEAWYGKGMSLAAGDKCVLQRTGRDPRWVVVGSFSTDQQGHNEETPPATADTTTPTSTTPTRTAHGVFTNNLGGVNFSGGTTQTIVSVTITTTGGIIKVQFSGWFYPNDNLANSINVYLNGNLAMRAGMPGNSQYIPANISFSHADLAAPAGTYTYSVTVNGAFCTVFCSSFTLVEV